MITKTQVLAHFHDSPTEVADYFGITTQAVHGWDENIPAKRAFALAIAFPQEFASSLGASSPAKECA